MTVALAGRAPATFEIKSAQLPLVSLLLKSPALDALAQELAARFGDIPDFFDHEPLVIDLTPLQATQADADIDFPALLTLLRQYRVQPIAVRGGSPAEKAGLKGGDVIVEFAGQKIANIYDYTYALDAVKIGVPISIVVLRDGEQITIPVTLSARPGTN